MKREELVEKMLDAFQVGNHSQAWVTRMSAALDVAVNELLQEPTSEELALNWNECASWPKDRTDWPYLTKALIASRRAQLEKVKTSRERVEVKRSAEVLPRWDVTLDGELLGQWEAEFTADVYAEGVRSGLISGLKEGSK